MIQACKNLAGTETIASRRRGKVDNPPYQVMKVHSRNQGKRAQKKPRFMQRETTNIILTGALVEELANVYSNVVRIKIVGVSTSALGSKNPAGTQTIAS